jgi:hypothetical protein
MLIEDQFIEPYVIDVYYNGFQIKEKNKNGTYQPIGGPIGDINSVMIVLTQLICVKKDGKMNISEFSKFRNGIMKELNNKLSGIEEVNG